MNEIGDYVNFRLSPDEQRLALSRVDPAVGSADLWLADLQKHVLTRFTFDPATDTAPVWSLDGKRIFFRSDRLGGNNLYEKITTGGTPERNLNMLETTFPTDLSPDGKLLVYHASSPVTTSYDVFTLPLPGEGKPIPFAHTRSTEIDGRFSPDGHYIAYASDESGQMQVYVQPFPPSGDKWQVSASGGSEPRWRRDGNELFYLTADGHVAAVDVKTAPTFESRTSRLLFQTHTSFRGTAFRMNYDVSADGRRFLVNEAVEAAAPMPITVVLNWVAGLKK